MRFQTIHRAKSRIFTNQQNGLVYKQEELLPFINTPFDLSAFSSQINNKKQQYSVSQRQLLVKVLSEQYAGNYSHSQKVNIEALAKENSFTITTGHQLSVLTGPLYFVIKILHTIKLVDILKKTYPEYEFIPVFWMASEDHDLEEIQNIHLFNKTFTWNQKKEGAVGDLNLDGFEEFKSEVKQLYSNNPEAEIHDLLDLYDGANLSEATFKLVNELFKDKGLLVLDAKGKALKESFSPLLKKELVEGFSYKAVRSTDEKLIDVGLKLQINPREINLFYLSEGRRDRILKTENGFEIEGFKFVSENEILEELELFPERFSPNVVLRPLYQEFLLPNLCYIGGTGEITYWLQLKEVFNSVEVPYPLIQVRNSLVWLDENCVEKMNKLNLTKEDLFENSDIIKRRLVEQFAQEDLDFSTINEHAKELSKAMLSHANDTPLEQFAKAELVKIDKLVQSFEEKFVRFVKKQNEQLIKDYEYIIERMFPNEHPQERYFSFFHFCPDGNYKMRLDGLYQIVDPLQKDLILIGL